MTREKIIQGLYRGDSRAIKEAIKALEQETCEDAISKSDVFEILGNLMSIPYDFDRQINEKDVSESMDEIRALPLVTPARKKGHWIDHSDEGFVECSNCGSATNCDGNIADLHFCFSCGAKMEDGKL